MIPSYEMVCLIFLGGAVMGGVLVSYGWKDHYRILLERSVKAAVDKAVADYKLSAGGKAKAEKRIDAVRQTVVELADTQLRSRDEVVADVRAQRAARNNAA
jgi:hypothetical protein